MYILKFNEKFEKSYKKLTKGNNILKKHLL